MFCNCAAQDGFCTGPISEVLLSGSAPNIFMSRAESHDAGGGRRDNEAGGDEGGGVEGRGLKERGAGDGECQSPSLSITVFDVAWLRQGDAGDGLYYKHCPSGRGSLLRALVLNPIIWEAFEGLCTSGKRARRILHPALLFVRLGKVFVSVGLILCYRRWLQVVETLD